MKKVLGMGNALVDIMTMLDNDDLLTHFSLQKGSMKLVDERLSKQVLDKTKGLRKTQAAGGSAANTIHGLANLGIKSGFMGKIGNDELGRFFKAEMEKNAINTILYESTTDSGRAIALVSPDSERTFATYLGASVELEADDLTFKVFEDYSYFHIEGYLVQNQKLLSKALQLAKDNNMLISLDLASYNVVNENLDFLQSIINKYVDVVFANEEEAKAFTGKEPEDAVNEIAKHCKFAIVKTGGKGSIIKSGEEIHYIDAIPVSLLDTTGAGDLYASGFLYGLANNMPLNKCGAIGSFMGGKVIEVIGAKMDAHRWESVHQMLKKL